MKLEFPLLYPYAYQTEKSKGSHGFVIDWKKKSKDFFFYIQPSSRERYLELVFDAQKLAMRLGFDNNPIVKDIVAEAARSLSKAALGILADCAAGLDGQWLRGQEKQQVRNFLAFEFSRRNDSLQFPSPYRLVRDSSHGDEGLIRKVILSRPGEVVIAEGDVFAGKKDNSRWYVMGIEDDGLCALSSVEEDGEDGSEDISMCFEYPEQLLSDYEPCEKEDPADQDYFEPFDDDVEDEDPAEAAKGDPPTLCDCGKPGKWIADGICRTGYFCAACSKKALRNA